MRRVSVFVLRGLCGACAAGGSWWIGIGVGGTMWNADSRGLFFVVQVMDGYAVGWRVDWA